jgi:hypothetical protein
MTRRIQTVVFAVLLLAGGCAETQDGPDDSEKFLMWYFFGGGAEWIRINTPCPGNLPTYAVGSSFNVTFTADFRRIFFYYCGETTATLQAVPSPGLDVSLVRDYCAGPSKGSIIASPEAGGAGVTETLPVPAGCAIERSEYFSAADGVGTGGSASISFF